MTFKGKPVKVTIIDDAKEAYEELNATVGKEVIKGIEKSTHQTLLNSIKQKIELLKENPQYGTHVEKKKIPKKYVQKYEVNNIWKVDLASAWRMIYTIKGSEVEIVAVILDVFDHKAYDKKFGYKSK